MENQHRKIKGYRELNEAEIAKMNKIKELAAQVGELVRDMQPVRCEETGEGIAPNFDQRWVAIAETDLQKGFMALTRSVAKPESF